MEYNLPEYYNFIELAEEVYRFNEYQDLDAKAKKEILNKPKLSKLNMYNDALCELDLAMAKVELQYNENGKVSATKTFDHIVEYASENFKKYLTYIYRLRSRSIYYRGGASDNTRYCAIVPLFLAAQKEYNGVPYEAWDKTNPKFEFFVTKKLWDCVSPRIGVPYSKESIKILRHNALHYGGKEISPSAWPNHNIALGNEVWKAGDFSRHIILQTWVANVDHRNEFMILDVNNWDSTPQAFDAVMKIEPQVPILKESARFDDLCM